MSENEHQDLKDAIVDLAHQIQRMAGLIRSCS